jgi:hypothetical protein
MSIQTIYKYRVWCNTENMYYETYGEEEPSVCPNNSAHDIDLVKTAVIETFTTEELRDPSGKQRIHQTSRPIGTKIHFTSRGDHIDYITDAGGGEQFLFHHHLEDNPVQTVYLDFNIAENRSYLHEGYLIWKGAEFDTISLDIVPIVTNIEPGSNTPYFVNPAMPYIILPSILAGGAGNYVITSDLSSPRGGLVYMPSAGDPQFGRPQAFWNAEYNTSTHLYENITPVPDGTGQYNMFTVEFSLARFANDILLLHNGFEHLKTSDTEELGQGMRVKATATTCLENGGDHEWSAACILTLHRARSV